jgi:hypothetical protein
MCWPIRARMNMAADAVTRRYRSSGTKTDQHESRNENPARCLAANRPRGAHTASAAHRSVGQHNHIP